MTDAEPRCYEFRLVIAGLDFEDDASVDTVLRTFDGSAAIEGTSTDLINVAITLPGDDPFEVVMAAVEQLQDVLSHATVVRLDANLVGISDIAQLTERTREAIRLYADGKRGPGGFPPPVGVVGDGVRVWRWCDVDEWLRQHLDYSFPTTPVPSWAIDRVNARLHERHGVVRRRRRVSA